MAAFHEQLMDPVVVGIHLDTPPNCKRETFQEVTVGMNYLNPSTTKEYKVVVKAGRGVPTLNMSPKICACS